MKHVSSLRDLEEFGIIPLTGEADALSFRCLCDLTPRGRKIFCECFGVQPGGLAEAWNSKGVASVMLPYEAVRPLGVIALVDDGCHKIIATEKAIYGIEHDEDFDQGEAHCDDATNSVVIDRQPRIMRHEDWMPWPTECYGKVQRLFTLGKGPRVGTRNVHAMSGRAA